MRQIYNFNGTLVINTLKTFIAFVVIEYKYIKKEDWSMLYICFYVLSSTTPITNSIISQMTAIAFELQWILKLLVSKFIVTKLLLEGLLPSFLSLSIIPAIMFAIEATIIWNKNIFVFIGKVGLKLQPLFL